MPYIPVIEGTCVDGVIETDDNVIETDDNVFIKFGGMISF